MIPKSVKEFLSTKKGKLIAFFVYIYLAPKISPIIGFGLPFMFIFGYFFLIYYFRDKIKNLEFYKKFIIGLPVYIASVLPLAQNEYFFPAQFFLILGIIHSGIKFSNIEKGKTFQNIPTSKMRSISMGLVEVKGKVETIDTLKDPIFGKPCVYYSVVISEMRKRGKNRRMVPIHVKEKSKSFYLTDETGSIFIDGALIPSLKAGFLESSKIDMKVDYYFGQTFLRKKKLPNQIQEYFDKVNIKNKRTQTCQITIIEAGDNLYSLGNARSLNDSENEHKEKASAALELSEDNRFVLSDSSEKELTNAYLGGSWLMPISLIFIGLFFLFAPKSEIENFFYSIKIFISSMINILISNSYVEGYLTKFKNIISTL